MNHQLTDEIIEQNFTPEYVYVESDSILGVSEVGCGFSCDDLRAAYDLGESKGRADMLRQCITWLETLDPNLKTQAKPTTLAKMLRAAMMREAMRLQVDN
jgi:hypothetical protein